MPPTADATLDLDALGPWLAAQGARVGRPLSAEKFAGGQSNPTFLLRGPEGAVVLRRKPPGQLLKSAHAVDREHRVQAALAATDVPVPRMIGLCEDESVIGSVFYVMEHVPGRCFDDPRLPDVAPATRRAMMAESARVLAAIHRVDLEAMGLADFGRPGDYFARQLDRWTRQYRATETETIPAMDALIAWLERNAPGDDGRRALVHGDYRIDNLLFANDGAACRAVLDWELSTLGHPFADVAAVLMQWRLPPGRATRGLAGEDRAALGLPSDEAYLETYARAAGLDEPPDLTVWLPFAFFRMAAILQGVRRRALDGNASDPERGLRLGAEAPRFAALGLEAAERG